MKDFSQGSKPCQKEFFQHQKVVTLMKRMMAPIALSAALTMSACGGGSFSHATSGAKDAASKVKSAATSPSVSSSTSPVSNGALVDDAAFKKYAEKLGCKNPTIKGNPQGKARRIGATGLIDCFTGSMEYLMVRTTTPDAASKAASAIWGPAPQAHGMPYVLGTNWIVLANKDSQDTPTKADAESVQHKLGGTIKTLP